MPAHTGVMLLLLLLLLLLLAWGSAAVLVTAPGFQSLFKPETGLRCKR